MLCPRCNKPSQVLDSRPDGKAVNRRRRCKGCGFRFATEEKVVGYQPNVRPSKAYKAPAKNKAPAKAQTESPVKRFSENSRDDLDDIWDDLSGSGDRLSLRDLGID